MQKGAFYLQDLLIRDPFTPPLGVKYQNDNTVDISSGNWSPAYNSSASVITASCLKWPKCHTSSFMNSTPFGWKIIQMLSLNKSRAEKVQAMGTKTLTHLKAYLMQMNYTLYILTGLEW